MDHKEQVISLSSIPNPSIFKLFWAHHAGRGALDALYGSTSDVIPTPLWHTLDLPLSWMVSTNVGHTAKVFFFSLKRVGTKLKPNLDAYWCLTQYPYGNIVTPF